MLLKVDYESTEELLADYLSDLSDGGLFIRTEAPFAVDETLRFSLSFPGLLRPVPLVGVVRWLRPADAHGEGAGVGCEFAFRDDSERSRLRRLLSQLRRQVAESGRVERQVFRVLLVDDNHVATDLFAHAVRRFHRQLGIDRRLEVEVAQGAMAAVELLTTRAFHLAVIDHALPGTGGAALISRIRQDPHMSAMPIVATGRGGPGVHRATMAAGADMFLRKPVLLDELMTTLRQLAPAALAASAAQDERKTM